MWEGLVVVVVGVPQGRIGRRETTEDRQASRNRQEGTGVCQGIHFLLGTRGA